MCERFAVAYIMPNRFDGYAVCLITRQERVLFTADSKGEIARKANREYDSPVTLFVDGPLPGNLVADTWEEHVKHAFSVNTMTEIV